MNIIKCESLYLNFQCGIIIVIHVPMVTPIPSLVIFPTTNAVICHLHPRWVIRSYLTKVEFLRLLKQKNNLLFHMDLTGLYY